MASEKYTNLADSTLNGAINDSVTSLDVVSASAFPSSGDFRILIGSEILLVTGVSTNTFTVTRGAEGTTAASHSNGDAVTHVVTAASIERIARKSVVEAGAIGSRPAAGDVGRLYLPNDGVAIHRDDGTLWTPYGPLFKFVQPPALSSFTGVNTTGGSTAVAADQGGIISIQKPPQNGVNMSMWVKNAPTPPYTVSVAMLIALSQVSLTSHAGICFRQSTDGNKSHGVFVRQTNVITVGAIGFTSLTTGADLYAGQNASPLGVWWFRLEDDNTNRKYFYSTDGVTWIQIYSHSRTTDITPDQIGFWVDHQTGSAAYDLQMKILSWDEQ